MIAALAIALQISPTFVLVPEPAAANVTIQALVRLPKLNDAERLCAKAAWGAILDGSEEYSYITLRSYSQQTGRPVLAMAMSDHLLLRVTFPKEQASTAFAMVESVLRGPLLEAASLEKSLLRLQLPENDLWTSALTSEVWKDAKPSRQEILGVYRRLVRPENLVLAIGGAIEPTTFSAERKRFADWNIAAERGYVRPWSATLAPLLKSPTEVGTVELSGKEFSATDANFPVRVLAAAALGVGRGSALTRVVREANGWSYRQEGFLQPTSAGFRLRLLFAHAGAPPVQELIDPVRVGLTAEVKGWTAADRNRALSVCRSWLESGLGFGPILLLPEGRFSTSLEGRTHLAGWWKMKFGTDLSPEAFLSLLEKVAIDDLKRVALEEVEGASVRLLVSAG